MLQDGIFSKSKEVHGFSRKQSTFRLRNFFSKEVLCPSALTAALLVTEVKEQNKLPTFSLKELKGEVHTLEALGIKSVMVFTKSVHKDLDGSEALNKNSLSIRAIKEIRDASNEICIITDNCLCTYTITGDCILRENDESLNRERSFEILNQHALLQSNAGADMIAPATMCEGAIKSMRSFLDNNGKREVCLMPHLSFRSALYRGYRQAMNTGTGSQREGFQIHPTNINDYINMGMKMVDEGADVLLLQPSLFSFDLIQTLKNIFQVQLGIYSVSGEYLMFNNFSYGNELMFEHAIGALRAGADFIISYGSKEIAQLI